MHDAAFGGLADVDRDSASSKKFCFQKPLLRDDSTPHQKHTQPSHAAHNYVLGFQRSAYPYFDLLIIVNHQ